MYSSILLVLSFIALQHVTFAQMFDMRKVENIPGSSITTVTQLQNGEILTGTPQGLWKTNALFNEWSKVTSAIFQDSMIYKVSTSSDGNIIVGTRKGIYISSDQGVSWFQPSTISKTARCKYIYAHNDNTVFVDADASLFRSLDGGVTWSLFAKSTLDAAYTVSNTESRIGAAFISSKNKLILKNYISSDGGQNFSPLPNELANTVSYSGDNQGNIYALTYNGAIGRARVFASTDNGSNWGNVGMSNNYDFIAPRYFSAENSFAFSGSIIPLENKKFLFCAFGSGTYTCTVRTDGTSVQVDIDKVLIEGLRSHYITCLYRLSDGTIVAGTLGSGLFVSKNNASNWTQVKPPFTNPIVNDFFRDYKRQLFYAGTLDGLYVSSDHGDTWNSLEAPGEDNNILAMTVVPQGDPVALTQKALYGYSYNQDEWLNIHSKLPQGFYPNVLKIRGNSLFVTSSGQVYFSSNVGKSWTTPQKVHGETITRFTDVPNTDIFVTLGPSGAFPKNIRFTFKKDWSIWQLYSDGLSVDVNPTDVISVKANQIFLATSNGTYNFSLMYNKWDKPSSGWLEGIPLKYFVLNPINQPHGAGNYGLYYFDDKSETWKQNCDKETNLIACAFDNKSNYYVCDLYGGVYRSTVPSVVLGTPELTFPINNANDVPHTSAKVMWKTVQTADRYYVQVSTTPDFATLVFNDTSATSLTTTPKNLLHTQKYYWRVRAAKLELIGDWSQTYSFTTLPVFPDKVTLLSPKNNSESLASNTKLIWSRPKEADSFHVQLSLQQDFSTIIINDSSIEKTDRNLNILSDDSQYFWRVRGKNRAGFGEWSEIWSFTTKGTSSVIDNVIQEKKVYIHENELYIKGVFISTPCIVTVSDIQGKQIMNYRIDNTSTQTVVPLLNLTAGSYIIRIGSITLCEYEGTFAILK